MTSPPETPDGPPSEEELRAELERVESQREELRRQVQELRAELTDAGPMDAADRAAIITQAEELEAFAAELDRRREVLLEKLGTSG